MPIDPSIYGGIRQPEAPNLLADFAQIQQIKGLQNQNQLATLGLQDRARSQAEQDQLRNALMSLGPNATVAQRVQAAQGTGTQAGYALGDSLQQSDLKRQETGAKVAKDNAEVVAKQAETQYALSQHHAQQLAMVQTPEDAVAFIDQGIRTGALPSDGRDRAIQVIQRQGVGAWKAMATDASVPILDKLKINAENARAQLQSDTSIKTTSMNNATSRANNAAQVGEMARGHTLSDQRARETIAQGKTPSGYRANPDGSLSAIPGGPADPNTKQNDKPLTDSQAKALGFGSRMKESARILDTLAAAGTNTPSLTKQAAEALPLIGPAAGAAANFVASGPQQQVEQAQRDFTNAVLRRESGAAISPSEFDNARKQYFDARGDSADVREQKKRNREIAMRGVLAEVPDAQQRRVGEVIGAPADASSDGWTVKVRK